MDDSTGTQECAPGSQAIFFGDFRHVVARIIWIRVARTLERRMFLPLSNSNGKFRIMRAAHCGSYCRGSLRSSRRLFKVEPPGWSDLSMDTARQLLYGLPAGRHGMLWPRTAPGEDLRCQRFLDRPHRGDPGGVHADHECCSLVLQRREPFGESDRIGSDGRTRPPTAVGSGCDCPRSRSGNGPFTEELQSCRRSRSVPWRGTSQTAMTLRIP